jgi:four helix bundle protein
MTVTAYSCGMTYDEWESTASESVRQDSAWKVAAFRLALYAGAAAWKDSEPLVCDPRGAVIAGQLVRSAASVAANVAEGYGRRSPKERVRFYEYALGSAGETRAWYVTVGRSIGPATLELRLANLLSLTRLLLTMIRRERQKGPHWMDVERAH